MLLPASFVLHLNTDLPLEVSKYEEIKRITGIPFIDTKQVKTAPLLQLITKSTSDESLDSSNNRGLFVVSNLYLELDSRINWLNLNLQRHVTHHLTLETSWFQKCNFQNHRGSWILSIRHAAPSIWLDFPLLRLNRLYCVAGGSSSSYLNVFKSSIFESMKEWRIKLVHKMSLSVQVFNLLVLFRPGSD